MAQTGRFSRGIGYRKVWFETPTGHQTKCLQSIPNCQAEPETPQEGPRGPNRWQRGSQTSPRHPRQAARAMPLPTKQKSNVAQMHPLVVCGLTSSRWWCLLAQFLPVPTALHPVIRNGKLAVSRARGTKSQFRGPVFPLPFTPLGVV